MSSNSNSDNGQSSQQNAAAAAANAGSSLQMQQIQMQQQQYQQQQAQLQVFWQNQLQEIQRIDSATHDYKNNQLPLARIKKIMKIDEEVRMISSEAPVLFAKACEIFILELTLRAWSHTEENKRRTLQRSDIALAITKTDMFDFLIDIVPRDDIKPSKKQGGFMDPQVIYHQQLQQQQAAMLHQYMQSQGGAPMMAWPQQLPQVASNDNQAQNINSSNSNSNQSSNSGGAGTGRNTVDV